VLQIGNFESKTLAKFLFFVKGVMFDGVMLTNRMGCNQLVLTINRPIYWESVSGFT
jgi:hypothetical protein